MEVLQLARIERVACRWALVAAAVGPGSGVVRKLDKQVVAAVEGVRRT